MWEHMAGTRSYIFAISLKMRRVVGSCCSWKPLLFAIQLFSSVKMNFILSVQLMLKNFLVNFKVNFVHKYLLLL